MVGWVGTSTSETSDSSREREFVTDGTYSKANFEHFFGPGAEGFPRFELANRSRCNVPSRESEKVRTLFSMIPVDK